MTARLSGPQWEALRLQLLVRSGGVCEARTPDCLAAPTGRLDDGRGVPVSVHHRLPRGMGGTSVAGVHGLARVLLVCGDGVTGCHGFIEGNRQWAYARGLLLAHGGADPAGVPVELVSGRRVWLDPAGGFYLDAPSADPVPGGGVLPPAPGEPVEHCNARTGWELVAHGYDPYGECGECVRIARAVADGVADGSWADPVARVAADRLGGPDGVVAPGPPVGTGGSEDPE